jgi:FkbM family methyltransferase
MVLRFLLNHMHVSHGLYVDIGAYHPIRLSNTYRLYCRGWSGINIEPTPGAKAIFDEYRPRDINLGIGVCPSERGTAVFYGFEQAELNTFSQEVAEERIAAGSRLIGTQEVEIRPLNEVLAANLGPGAHIDVMSMDCEGLDDELLRGLDWNRFRPTVLLYEATHTNGDAGRIPDSVSFLGSLGYSLFAHIGPTIVVHQRR